MPSNEMFIEHPDGTRSDRELWAEILDPDEMPDEAQPEDAETVYYQSVPPAAQMPGDPEPGQ